MVKKRQVQKVTTKLYLHSGYTATGVTIWVATVSEVLFVSQVSKLATD